MGISTHLSRCPRTGHCRPRSGAVSGRAGTDPTGRCVRGALRPVWAARIGCLLPIGQALLIHLLVALVLGPSAAPVHAAAGWPAEAGPARESSSKALRRLEDWAESSNQRLELVKAPQAENTVQAALPAGFEQGERLDSALLTLYGRELLAPPSSGSDARPLRMGAFADGLAQRLRGQYGAGTTVFLADRVLLMPGTFLEPQRIAALQLLSDFPQARATESLCFVLNDARASVREQRLASSALVPAPGSAAVAGLVRAVEHGPGASRAAARAALVLRLRAPQPGDPKPGEGDLAASLAKASLGALLDRDWTIAEGAAELACFVPAEQAVPALIEALFVWKSRRFEQPGNTPLPGAGRTSLAIHAALQELTGRTIPPDPERWQRMLAAVQAGAPLCVPPDPNATSAASFFGLTLGSDQVAFIVDRSGSMAGAPPPNSAEARSTNPAQTRLEAASAELLRALEHSGPETWFQIALFSSTGQLWRTHLTRADEQGLRQARGFLAGQSPDGGTQLASGIEAWLGGLDPRTGRPPVDTVVILCDGETVENARWAQQLLLDPRVTAVRFHCVQIGGARADALQALCTGSGGRLVRL
jgi:von Willebrand factor type A domain